MKIIIEESPFYKLFGMQIAFPAIIPRRAIKNKTILDIGCGFGWFEKWAIDHGAKTITGIDVSPEELSIAKTLKHPSVHFKKASAIKLPFKDNSFDTIVSWEVIEHIPKNTEILMFKEIYRVLKPSGHFYFSTQYANFIATLTDPAWWLIGHRHYTKKILINLIKKSGLKVENIYKKGSIFAILFTFNLYISKWIFRRDIFLKSYFYKKTTEEFLKNKGITNIIFSCIKPL